MMQVRFLPRAYDLHGGYGVAAALESVALPARVQIPLATHFYVGLSYSKSFCLVRPCNDYSFIVLLRYLSEKFLCHCCQRYPKSKGDRRYYQRIKRTCVGRPFLFELISFRLILPEELFPFPLVKPSFQFLGQFGIFAVFRRKDYL